MRMGVAVVVAIGCGGEPSTAIEGTQTYAVGPFALAPDEESSEHCVQITLDNDEHANVNAVELASAAGLYHSHWFFVPESAVSGPDGTFRCEDRGFSHVLGLWAYEPGMVLGALVGTAFFAHSHATPHRQQFPAGSAVRIPPRHKLIARFELVNPTSAPLEVKSNIEITYIGDEAVTTRLLGATFQNASLALPPTMKSRFVVECDLSDAHQNVLGRAPDFKIHHVLAHQHALGTNMTVEAVKPSGERTDVQLGGAIEPPFDVTGYTKLRLSCEYNNPNSTTVGAGNGDREACAAFAFTDSEYTWAGGALHDEPPLNPQLDGDVMTYQNPCSIFVNDVGRD